LQSKKSYGYTIVRDNVTLTKYQK